MKRRIRLFIGGQEVEFKSVPDILYNFQVDSLTEPSAVKNTYSKTIQIPSTPKNDRIFDNFRLNDYHTGGVNFDASRKTDFTIYVDSDIYETGYCRLDGISQNKHYFEYQVSLFGGLGEFFYNLSYKDNPAGDDEKLKLSDLDFYGDSETPLELGFTINKDTVAQAWEDIDDDSTPWGTINFASCYNGLPDDFDANKVLMNVGGSSAPSGSAARPSGARTGGVITSVTEDNVTYRTYGGYALAELPRDYTAAEMREFRSYLMRPVLRVKSVLDAVCRPENNGGWEVELDGDFFASGNCYYQDLWMTLSQLSTLDYNSSVVSTATTVSIGDMESGSTSTGDTGYYEDRLAYLSDADSGYAYDVNVKISLDITDCDSTDDTVVLCAHQSSPSMHYAAAVFVQLVAYDGFGNPVAGSDMYYLTNAYGTRRNSRGASAYFLPIETFDYRQPYGDGYITSNGNNFRRVSGGTFRWSQELSLTAEKVPAGSTLKVLVTQVYKNDGTIHAPKHVFSVVTGASQTARYTDWTFGGFDVTVNSSRVSFKTNEGIRTGAAFTKKQLLDTDFSPAEFLLSYMKIFGLYAIKDTPEKKIKILSRKNFFRRDDIVDIQNLIDRSSLKITPLVFNSKWYDWNLEADESEYGKAYETTYGKKYGRKKINTGYSFNRDTQEVLDGNIFRSAVQVLERSDAFCYTGNDTRWKPWMSGGYKYLLYDTTDNANTYEMDIPASSTIDAYSAFTEGYLYYDLYDKVQLHTADNSPADGNNVLLLRSGERELSNGSVNLNYFITDDNAYHNVLNNGRPCWLFTNVETDNQGNGIATRVTSVPYFSRYQIYPSSGYIVRSLDFGKPDEIYIPNAYYRAGSTLYEEFWESYISDLYSRDSRVVRTKMLIRELPSVDWLRRFYHFDSSIWRMTAISDYSVGEEKLTEVEFVKVQDVENYTCEVITPNPEITLTLSSYEIGHTGGTVDFTVTVSNGGDWYIGHADMGLTPSVTAGTGDYTGTLAVEEIGGGTVQYRMIAYADNSSAEVILTQSGVALAITGPTESGDVPWTGGTRTFNVISDLDWTIGDITGSFITSISPLTGTSTTGTTVTVTVGENDNESRRQTYLTITNTAGGFARSAYISQEAAQGAGITVTPTLINNVPYTGGTYQAEVYSTDDWTAANAVNEVMSVTPTTGHSGTTTITVTVNPNDSAPRFGNVYFSRNSMPAESVNLTVYQLENPNASISVSPQTVTGFTAAGGTLTVEITSTNDWKGYIYSSALMSSPSSGTSGTTQVTLTVAENTTGAERTLKYRYYIGTSPNDIYTEIQVTQYGD